MLPDLKYNLAGKRVCIAGETGMVGQAVQQCLIHEDCEIISAPHRDLDLTNQSQVLEWMAQNKPDVIIMAAGRVGGIGANSNAPADFLYDNLAMAQNVIHSAYQAKVEKLIYLGSSCIYPKYAKQPIKEDALLTGALEPSNEGYAIAKIAGIKLCQFYRQQYGCDFISLMPCNLYGAHDHFDAQNSHVIPALILKIHQAKMHGENQVKLWGTGSPLREFLYVDDLAEGIIHALKYYSEDQILNIGSGEEISIKDLSNMIKDIVGYSGKIIFNPEKPDGTPRKILDSTRINNLGWNAQTSLNAGLNRAYQWFLDNC